MSNENPNGSGDQDALADEWAAALAEALPEPQPAAPSHAIAETDRVEDASRLFPKLSGSIPGGDGHEGPRQDLEMILDIPVQLTVELGRTRIPIKHILQLAQGSVVELDALAGEPMDVLVNGCLIAQGEVVVVNDKFGIRLTDIVTPSERIRRLNKH
jgi:flagellar motor switch protein FliN/FliY